MKKKISYLMLIVISVIGSRLIFGQDYYLNSDNLIDTNLYAYDIFGQTEVLSYYVDGEYLFYIAKNNNQYDVVKYNLISNKRVEEYVFSDSSFVDAIKIFKKGSSVYVTSLHSNSIYKFDKELSLLEKKTLNTLEYDSIGLFNNDLVYTKDNNIYYKDKLIETIPNSCGNNIEVIYDKDTYLHFHNYSTGFGCLYNLDDKEINYLNYEKINVVNNRFLENQSNRISFIFDNNTYYFNDITESNNLNMRITGDYLFAIDTANSNMNIYNLDTSKIIYKRGLDSLKMAFIENVLIDDYAYFTILKDDHYILYIWDYLKENRVNKDMIYYDEREYKFKNNELIEEIKNKYNIEVYLYDQSVQYFRDLYVIPSYDDILINSRLNSLKEVLEKISENNVALVSNYIICFDKDLIFNDETMNTAYTTFKDNYYISAFNITNDNFKDDLIMELLKIYPILSSDLSDN